MGRDSGEREGVGERKSERERKWGGWREGEGQAGRYVACRRTDRDRHTKKQGSGRTSRQRQRKQGDSDSKYVCVCVCVCVCV